MIITYLKKDTLKETASILMEVFNSEPWNENWTKHNAIKKINELYNLNNSINLIIKDKKQIIGFLSGNIETFHDEKSYFLKEIAILEKYQHQGFGSFLLQEIEKLLKKQNINSIYLITHSNSIAEKFYIKNGFNKSEKAIIMKKSFV